jgi:hypothetical protein
MPCVVTRPGPSSRSAAFRDCVLNPQGEPAEEGRKLLISYKHKFLFVHIAKTGGTSIRAALRPYRWKDAYGVTLTACNLLSQLTYHRLGIKFPRHAKAIAAKEMLPPDLWRELFKFTIVRNPFDLQVSSYHHMQKEMPAEMADVGCFEAFIHRKFDPGRKPGHPAWDDAAQRMVDYVIDLDGKVILDFIARYEKLQADFETICVRIGIPTPELPHRRKAEGRATYRAYYTPETHRIVEEHYKRDLELFGYEF